MKLHKAVRTLFVLFYAITTFAFAQESKSNFVKKFERENGSNLLTVDDAVEFALKNNPELNSFQLEIDALGKTISQQGLLPNPELGFEVENILGSGALSGFRSGEFTATVTQEIPLGGKISKRTRIAESVQSIARIEYTIKLREIISGVHKKYNEIVSLNRLNKQQTELVSNAVELYDYVKLLYVEGHSPEADISRASISVNQLKMERDKTRRLLESSIQQFARMIGVDNLTGVEFTVENPADFYLPGYEELSEMINRNPSLSRLGAIVNHDDFSISYQKALAIPDISIGLGIRRINEINENAFVVGFSLPLPVHNSNSLGVEEALIRRDANKSLFESEKIRLQRELTGAYSNAVESINRIKFINKELLPESQRLTQSLSKGYREGRYSLLELLDSHKTSIELEIEYNNAVEQYYDSVIDIENITGRSLLEIKGSLNNEKE